METLTLQPILYVNGTIDLPGSKSISNRVLLLAALSNGITTLNNLLDSDDTRYMLNALKLLGIDYKLSDNRTCCKVIGNGAYLTAKFHLELFLGNAGTVMRMLTAVLCLSNNNIVLTGESRMKKRPIGHLVNALRQGGAKIDYLEQKNYPPLYLQGGFIGGNLELDGRISSQFLTALLIAAPLASEDTKILIKGNLVSRPYIDITLNLMKTFKVLVDNQDYRCFTIKRNQQYKSPNNYIIEGDASSASYFLAAAAIKGGTVKVKGISRKSIQGDIVFSNILEKMGAIVTRGNDFIACTNSGNLEAINMDANFIPDIAMTIAIMALFTNGITTLYNIYNWRVKETDRLFAMAEGLSKVGAIVEEGSDFIRILPPTNLKFAKIDTYNDHRIAMCFSLVALSNTPVTIINPKCVSKTFPNYFNYLIKISKLAS